MIAVTEAQQRWLIALRAPIPARVLRSVAERSPDLSALFALDAAQRQNIGLSDDAWRALQQPDPQTLARDRAWLSESHNHLLTWGSEDYPSLLCETSAAPAALFVQGDPHLLWRAQVAVVGSRNPSAGGADNARAFAHALAEADLCVTSGLADGVDTEAHRAALDAGQPTIAVVGTGPDVVYPARNRRLAEQVAKQGCIVSELCPGTGARPDHFPRRNRIIAGLSLGTLVVEAALKSGALITARQASELGREVFAIPGSIHNPMARGCHQLIREGALLIEHVQEVLDAIAPAAQRLGASLQRRLHGLDESPSADTLNAPVGDPDYQRLRAALGHDPVALDALAERSGLTVAALSSMLLLLELEGIVQASHGRYSLRMT